MTQQQAKKIVRFGQLAKYHELLGATSVMETREVTWSELKTLRDGGLLTAGQWYRITDYQCTTTQENTQSAGHQFDIIVRADSTDTLNENAYAAHHAGDTYFANSKLEAWKLLYCLDNDTSRFAWADSTNGKGVIYFMRDDWGNEVPYDFKNILFDIDATKIYTDAEEGETYQCYTFSLFEDGYGEPESIVDESVVAKSCIESDGGGKFGNNIIKQFLEEANGVQKLNSNIFTTDWSNDYIRHYNNIFGYDCYKNTLKAYCNYNTFGDNCYSNTFGNDCYSNTFGNDCRSNTFGDNCYYNTFGNDCRSNTFGNDCHSNTFGNDCNNNTFLKDYSYFIIIESGNQYINITSTQTTSGSNLLRNIKIAQGVNNTTTTKTISHNSVNDTFQTIYKPVNSVEVSV